MLQGSRWRVLLNGFWVKGLLFLIGMGGAVLAQERFGTGVVTIRSGSKRYVVKVEVAATAATRALGLMFRPTLAEGEGMLFIQPEISRDGFWMKNTLIPLSIAFLDPSGRIVDLKDMEPCQEEPCPVYFPNAPYRYALEVPKGYFQKRGIRIGDQVTWKLHDLSNPRR